MQTKPRPSSSSTASDEPANLTKSIVPNHPLLRGLNIGLGLSGLLIYALYITKGAGFYSSFPGGRKLLFGAAVLALGGLLAARLYLGFGMSWLSALWRRANIRTGLLHWLPVGLIVGMALLVRLWGTTFGLPYLEQVDEWNVAERALHIIQTGSFDPLDYRHPPLPDNDRQAFTYPSLYTYLQSGVFAARFLQGVTAGHYDGTNNLSAPLVKAEFYEWGRGLTALLGAGTVLLVFLVGQRYYGRRTGTVAALFLCFFYLHALNSRWITTDVPSGFFALLPFFWIYRIGEDKARRRDYLIAGLLCGLAMASKYNNLLIILPLMLAHFLSRPPRRWFNWNLPLAFVAAFAGFFLTSPFIFFHLPNFFTDAAAIINHYQNEGHPGFDGSDNWRFYIGALWSENAAVVALGLLGVGLAFARHKRHDVILLSFPLLSYIQLSGYKVNFTRNLMPIIPFLTIFAGWALVLLVEFVVRRETLDWLARRGIRIGGGNRERKLAPTGENLELISTEADGPELALSRNVGAGRRYWMAGRWQGTVLAVLALAAIVSPALTIIDYDRYNAQPTNRARATTWIQANLPRGSKLWIEPFSTDLLPRNAYRVEGGKSVLEYPPEWYAANGYNYLVLSEAYYKEAYETGKPSVQAAYRAFIEGPRPPGFELVQDFPKNKTDRPGARIMILATGLPAVAASPQAYAIARPLQLDFGGKLRLVGADGPISAKAGTTLPLVFYWQTISPVQQDYTTFIHLLDSAGKIVAQLDLAPLSGTRPTSLWQPGETVRDEYPLALPANLPPGEYRLTLGLYLPPNGARLVSNKGDEPEVARLKIEN